MHKIAQPEWLGKDPWSPRVDPIDIARTALIVVDLQNYFLVPGGVSCIDMAREIVPTVNRIAAKVRESGGTVVFLQHTYDENGPRPVPLWQHRIPEMRDLLAKGLAVGSVGHSLYPSLHVQSPDLRVNKFRPSAFIAGSSHLHEILQSRGIDTLIVTGTMTNVCCESTARDAQMLDYKVLFVSDATASMNDDLHNATLMTLQYYFAEVLTTNALLDRVSKDLVSNATGHDRY